MKKINVSMIGTLPPLKAISSYCYELINELDKNTKVTFFSFSSIYPRFMHPSKDDDKDNSFKELNFKNTLIHRFLKWNNPFSWLKAGFINKSEIFHIQCWSLPTFPIIIVMSFFAYIRKIPIITTVHNVKPHEKSFIFEALSKLIFKFTDKFIVHSNVNKEDLSIYYNINKDNINVIPHGPLNLFKESDYDEILKKEEFFKKYNLIGNEKILLFFGAIRPYKNLELIIESIPYAIKENRVKLVVAGSLWEDWGKYEYLINKNKLGSNVIKEIQYIPTNDVSLFFAAADLVLIPYKEFNSQSGVGAAALSFNKPVIISDKGGLKDLVKDELLILKNDDPVSLAKIINTIFSDESIYKKLKSDCEKINKDLSWESICEKTIDLYKKMISDRA